MNVRLANAVRAAMRAAAGWLEPRGGRCRVCDAPLSGRRPLAAEADGPPLRAWLCAGCAASIPWIRRPACLRCGRPVFCPDCARHPVRAFELNRSAVRYDAAMREWLALYKYRGSERLERPLAAMMIPAYERLAAAVAASERNARCAGERRGLLGRLRPPQPPRLWRAVTFVPVSRERAEERGFNQAERLAQAVAARARAPLVPLLVRARHGERQSMKGRADRFRNMRGMFGPDEAGVALLRQTDNGCPARILLVDDIYTTGATADACAAAIRESLGARCRVYVLTWARS